MPHLFFADLVRETSTATGTSSLALAGAVPGHRSFAAAVPPGSRFHYSIAGVTHEQQWEVGEGSFADGALTDRSVLASSSANGLVDFSPGLKIITLTVAADWFAAREDRSDHVHGIADVENLQTALDSKQVAGSYASASHGHGIADVTGLQSALEGKQPAGSYAAASHDHASLQVTAGTAASPALSFAADPDTGVFAPGADALAISTGGAERARFTADGRLGVGTISPMGAAHFAWNGWQPDLNLNAAVVLSGTFGGGLLLKDGISSAGFWTADSGFSLIVGIGESGLTAALEIRQNVLQPVVDSAAALGHASRRWSQLYAATGTINTSDTRDKHWLGALSSAEMAAGREIIAELGLFQWLAAREAKGPDEARLHFGVRAQSAFAILTRHGLDWRRYAWCCHDAWEDEDGPRERFGIRSDQLALFLIAVLAQQMADLSADVTQVPDAGA